MNELTAEIQDAFAGQQYPEDDNIALRRPDCPGYEGEEVWRLYNGRSWREILRVGRELDLSATLSFLTFEGFVYYLPAFLTLAMDVDGGLDNSLVFKLWSFPEEVASRLRPREKRAVVHVLEFLASEYEKRNYTRNDARVALDHYWAYFTDKELGVTANDVQE